jgi:hypothetical protein
MNATRQPSTCRAISVHDQSASRFAKWLSSAVMIASIPANRCPCGKMLTESWVCPARNVAAS